MSEERKRVKWWQISLRTLLIMVAVLPAVTGLFYGTFGEPARELAVRALSQLARVLLPMGTAAILILLVIGLAFVVKRVRNS